MWSEIHFLKSSISIEISPGQAMCIVERGHELPISKLIYFTTSEDLQESLELKVLRGSSTAADQNELVARVHVSGIAPAPLGAQRVEIGFYVDEKQKLTFTTKDYPSGNTLPNQVQYVLGNEA